ncbi:hypothetical protein LWI29_004338 [Acer saccharum]|uniref:non-specific serine/threonine protein kinase n=1 Tax=Acer saccharum TaxID=4024 RepID=A0AA39SSS0_ACESA|nr:hypothetical protein LWI29_004338 [Acer saccharum]
MLVHKQDELIYTYELSNDTVITRLLLHQLGKLQRLVWNWKTTEWSILYSWPFDMCDNYAQCGSNNNCRINKTPICECLKGFIPKAEDVWDTQGSSQSRKCIEKSPSENCLSGEGFLKLPAIKLPDFNWFNNSMNIKECEAECFKNCSCRAYANSDVSGSSGCLMWFGDLIDIRECPQGLSWGHDIFLRVPASELGSRKEVRSGPWNGRQLGGTPFSDKVVNNFIFKAMLVNKQDELYYTYEPFNNTVKTHIILDQSGTMHRRVWNWKTTEWSILYTWPFDSCDHYAQCGANNNCRINKTPICECLKGFIPKAEDEWDTHGLSQSRKCIDKSPSDCPSGEGFLKLPAIKLPDFNWYNNSMNINECEAECFKNCSCRAYANSDISGGSGCLMWFGDLIDIRECPPGFSWGQDIFLRVPASELDDERSKFLSWRKRFDIIIGIARGLLYLHQDSKLQIIHRDLKASNILLDNDLNPKISDFGLARIFRGDDKEANTKRIAGTYGYMSPEYATDGNFSLKSDVFSFGVLLLEIISGKKNRGFCHPDHHLNLLGHAWVLWNNGRSLEVKDVCLEDSVIESQVIRCIQVGLLCVQMFPEDRPEMSSVVFMLANEGLLLPQPKQPGFFTERGFITGSTSSSKEKFHTENAMSITTLDGR